MPNENEGTDHTRLRNRFRLNRSPRVWSDLTVNIMASDAPETVPPGLDAEEASILAVVRKALKRRETEARSKVTHEDREKIEDCRSELRERDRRCELLKSENERLQNEVADLKHRCKLLQYRFRTIVKKQYDTESGSNESAKENRPRAQQTKTPAEPLRDASAVNRRVTPQDVSTTRPKLSDGWLSRITETPSSLDWQSSREPNALSPTDLDKLTSHQAAKRKRALDETGYAYQEVVRKRDERRRMPTHTCPHCEDFIRCKAGTLKPEELDALRRACRHRSYFKAPSTPEGFWELSFQDSIIRRRRRRHQSDSDSGED